MAEAYTKTIKFEAKDAQVKKAVKELGKSLDGIDKSLDKINQAFTKSVKGGIKETIKGVGEISAIVKNLANITKKIEVVPKQKITQSIKDIRKINNLMKQLKTVSSPFSGDARKSDERNAAVDGLQKYINAVTNGTRAIGTNEAALNRQANAFALVAANVKIGSAQYINVVQAQEKAEQKLRLAQLDRIKAQEQLYAVSNLQKGIDQTGFKNVNKLLAMESNRFMQGGASDTTASLNAYKAELENVNSLLKIGSKEYYLVEEAIERINRRLGTKTRLVREEEKAVASQAKFYRDITAQIDKFGRKGVRNIGKVFEGKFGGTAQAGGIYALTRGIEDLTTKWKFLDQQIKIPLLGDRQLSSVANFVRRSQEGIAALVISYQGLSGLLGAASWTIGAIAGFKKWESEAASAIWSVNRQVKAFSDSLNAMYLMLQGKGGTPGGVAQNLRDMILGGEQRQENQRYADQGPTNKQIIQKDLDLQIQKLQQRNTTEQDYVEILQRQKQLERELRREEKKERVMRVKAGEPFEKVFKDEIDARDKRLKEAVDKELEYERGLRKERAKRAKFNKQVLQSELKDIAKKRKEELDAINKIRKAERQAAKEAEGIRRRKAQQRRDAMSRFGENVMLGAGFPMLFGGGPGAVAGGLTGAITQSAIGSKGFGMQIFFSAIGQQLDAFAGKAIELGKALKDPTEALGKLSEMGIKVDKSFERQIESMVEAGHAYDAQILVQKEVAKIAGRDGVMALKNLGVANEELVNKANQLRIKIMSDLAPAFMVLIDLASKFVDAIGAEQIRDKAKVLTKGSGDPLLAQRWTDAENKATASARAFRRKQIEDDPNINKIDKWAALNIGQVDRTFTPESKKIYYDSLTQSSKEILREMAPGYLGTEGITSKAMGEELTFDTPVDLAHQKDLAILDKKISLLKDSDSLTKKEILNRKIAIVHAETELKLQQLINKENGEGLNQKDAEKVFKDEEFKIAELTKDYNDDITKSDKQPKKQYEDKIKDLDKEIAYQTELMNMDNGSYEMREKEAEIAKQVLGLSEEQTKELTDRLNKLYDLQDANEEIRQQEEQINALYSQIGSTIKNGLVEGINAAIDGTKTLGEVAGNVFRSLSRMLLNYGISTGLGSMFPNSPSWQKFFGGGMAAGGPVSGDKSYIVGEKGPELFIPNSSGTIVPNHDLGGSGANIVVNVDASGSSVEGDAGQAEQLGTMLAVAVQSELIRQKRPGGLLSS